MECTIHTERLWSLVPTDRCLLSQDHLLHRLAIIRSAEIKCPVNILKRGLVQWVLVTAITILDRLILTCTAIPLLNIRRSRVRTSCSTILLQGPLDIRLQLNCVAASTTGKVEEDEIKPMMTPGPEGVADVAGREQTVATVVRRYPG